MNIHRLALVLVVLLNALCSAHAEDNKIHYRVKLNITAPDSIRSEVNSYMSRELRRIGDIDLVEDDPWIVISVLSVAMSSRGGQSTGYAFLVFAEQPVRYRQMRDILAAKFDKATMAAMDLAFEHTTRVLSQFIQVGATDELENLCGKIVADLDGDVFESQRKFAQQVTDQLKNIQPVPAK